MMRILLFKKYTLVAVFNLMVVLFTDTHEVCENNIFLEKTF